MKRYHAVTSNKMFWCLIYFYEKRLLLIGKEFFCLAIANLGNRSDQSLWKLKFFTGCGLNITVTILQPRQDEQRVLTAGA